MSSNINVSPHWLVDRIGCLSALPRPQIVAGFTDFRPDWAGGERMMAALALKRIAIAEQSVLEEQE
jgi:hypothetical protein